LNTKDYFNKEVEVKGKGNVFLGTVKGQVIPNENKELLVLKLDSGYNVAIKIDNIETIKIISDTKINLSKPKTNLNLEKNPKLKNICIISLGGTIASRVDYASGGVSSQFNSEDLVYAIPEIKELANIETISLMSKFSENLDSKDWIILANLIKENVPKYDGFVIAMGTDTLQYTSSALNFILDISLPVVFVGAQRSSDRPSSDAAYNLLGALSFINSTKKAGVFVAMHYNLNDETIAIHLASRVKKMHSTRRDAFKTINTLPYAFVNLNLNSGKIVSNNGSINENLEFLPNISKNCKLNINLSDKVCLFKIYPDVSEKLFEFVLTNYEVVILEGFGMGHLPNRLFPIIKNSKCKLFMCSQTIAGKVNLNVYSTGREELDLGIIPLENLLSEIAFTKAKVFAKEKDFVNIMKTNLKGEIIPKSESIEN
jgi:glutamyl-tRNA(Gln) amidotransferase subunit D